MKSRIKMAIKCLLGKPIVSPVQSHQYKLTIDDTKKLAGLNVMVTGGTGAIGSAICYELAAMGATVGICGRSSEKIKSTIDYISLESPMVAQNLVPVVLDVNNDNQIQNAIEKFNEEHGLDAFINNAGGQNGRVGKLAAHIFENSIEDIDLVLDTNLRGTILCSRIAAQIMARQKCGTIISMASVIGIGGKAGYCDYAATKAGIIGFTKSLALEMAQYGVRVNCISPGLVNQTPFDEGSPERYTELTALKRAGYTKEIADAVVFLLDDKYITGQNIVVDGGRSLGLYGDK